MLSQLIGVEMARTAVDLHRAGKPAQAIVAALWGDREPPIDRRVFGEMLLVEVLEGEATLPTATLPEDLAEAAEQLKTARQELVENLNDGEGSPNILAHAALCKHVDTAIKLHKFRMDLEKHSVERFLEEEERRKRRKPSWVRGTGKKQ